MNEIYEIPESVKDLFENGENSYKIISYEREMDNNQSMSHFLDCLDVKDENIELNDGTQVILKHPDYNFKLQIDSGGLGDFFSHGFDVIIIKD